MKDIGDDEDEFLEIDESNIDILLKDEDEQEMCADEDFKFSYE